VHKASKVILVIPVRKVQQVQLVHKAQQELKVYKVTLVRQVQQVRKDLLA
jgi:hypothetical protein